ncbi:MAG: zinc ribbon domain-containing protein [Bacteroidia bacterium]
MEKIKCTHCDTDNLVTAKYCSRCGYELPKVQSEITTNAIQQPTPKKKLSVKGIIGIAVGIGTMFAVQQFLFKTPSYDKVMMQIASELNKTCPIMVDAETRLDNAIALPPNVFQYNYTLVNMDKVSVDTNELKNNLEPIVINTVKTNPQMQFQRDHKTTMNYSYKDRSGQFLFMISVTPDKYE